MRQPFHMTGGLRVVSTLITTLLRLGLPVGPAVLLSVRGRTSGTIYTIPVELVENPDILKELAARLPPGQILAGFGAETENIAENGRAKLAAKGCDLLVVNQVGHGLAFGTSDNAALVLGADGSVTEVPRGSKDAVAAGIWTAIAAGLA